METSRGDSFSVSILVLLLSLSFLSGTALVRLHPGFGTHVWSHELEVERFSKNV